MQSLTRYLADEDATLAFGEELATQFADGGIILLQGDLGAGKTTLVRGILRTLGYAGHIKSPTYTLVEPYQLDNREVYHFDLYRLGDPEELEYLGVRDYFHPGALCLIEWPEKAAGMLPHANAIIRLDYKDSGRLITLKK